MFSFLELYVVGAILVTLCAGVAAILLHAVFGPNLPPSIQALEDTFTAVFKAGATVFLGPAQIVRRIRISLDSPSSDAPNQSSPIEDTKQITKL